MRSPSCDALHCFLKVFSEGFALTQLLSTDGFACIQQQGVLFAQFPTELMELAV